MDLETAIRSRRTHKAYRAEPIGREVLDELFELARWAPNHHLTNPWRFRVIGPRTLGRMKELAGLEGAGKLDRAPSLVAVSSVVDPADELLSEENLFATGCAAYIVLVAAHGRGLAGYWRTPGFLRSDAGREVVGIGAEERFVGLLYLGHPVQERRPPERAPLADTVDYTE